MFYNLICSLGGGDPTIVLIPSISIYWRPWHGRQTLPTSSAGAWKHWVPQRCKNYVLIPRVANQLVLNQAFHHVDWSVNISGFFVDAAGAGTCGSPCHMDWHPFNKLAGHVVSFGCAHWSSSLVWALETSLDLHTSLNLQTVVPRNRTAPPSASLSSLQATQRQQSSSEWQTCGQHGWTCCIWTMVLTEKIPWTWQHRLVLRA